MNSRRVCSLGFPLVALSFATCLSSYKAFAQLTPPGVAWKKTFTLANGGMVSSLQKTRDGGYIAAGTAGGNAYLAKTDGSGNLLWEKSFGGQGTRYARVCLLCAAD